MTPLAIVLVLFTGIGPLLAWRRVSAGTRSAAVRWPLGGRRGRDGRAVVALTDAVDEPGGADPVRFAAFALAALRRRVRRAAPRPSARSPAAASPSALGRVVARNRRRYGGYIVHAGIAILFIAVAASSSFQTSRDVRMLPGDSDRGRRLQVTYVRPTASIDPRSSGSPSARCSTVERDGEPFATLHPSRNYYSSAAPTGGAAARASSRARRPARSAAAAGPASDLWTAMRPDLAPRRRGDRRAPTGGSTRRWPGDRAEPTDARADRGDARRSPTLQGEAIRRASPTRYIASRAAGRLPRSTSTRS